MMENNILLYVLCHNDETQKVAANMIKGYEEYFKIITMGKSPYFESQVFDYLSDHQDEWTGKTYVGMITYSFGAKSKLTIPELITSVKANAKKDERPDVLTFHNILFIKYKLKEQVSFIEAVGLQHGPFVILTILRLFEACGYKESDIFVKNIHGFFCNYWAASPEFMGKYVRFYKQSKALIEIDPTLANYMLEKSYYPGNISKEDLVAMTGKEYYTLHAFLFERLPSIFFHLEKAKLATIGKYYLVLLD